MGRRRRRRNGPLPENSERWLLTYADLITLLLAFFVVMYSMSRLDAKKFGAMSTAFSGILKGQNVRLQRRNQDTMSGGGPIENKRLRLMQAELQNKVSSAHIGPSVSSEVTERGLVIHVREGALFEEARAVLTDGARAVLRTIGEEIKDAPNHIRIEGHTDSRPINTPRYPSNWELSTARATAVLRFLADSTGFPTERISAVGFGAHRPVAANDTPENMMQNRRVDIVLLNSEMSRAEPSSPKDARPEVVIREETGSR